MPPTTLTIILDTVVSKIEEDRKTASGMTYLAQSIGNLFSSTQQSKPYSEEVPLRETQALINSEAAVNEERMRKLDELYEKVGKLSKDKLKFLGIDKPEQMEERLNSIYEQGGLEALDAAMMALGRSVDFLGGTIVAQKDDDVGKIAQRLGITPKQLLELNPQLKERKDLVWEGELINTSKDNVGVFSQ